MGNPSAVACAPHPLPSLPQYPPRLPVMSMLLSDRVALLGPRPLVQRGPRGPGAAQIPCLCQRSLGSRHRGSISALPFPTQHSLYLLSHTTPEVSRLPLSLPDPVCECVWEEQLYFNANRQKKKNPVAVGAEARWASCLLIILPPSLPSPSSWMRPVLPGPPPRASDFLQFGL